MQNDVIRRFPKIKWIAAHAGGSLPFLADRVEELKDDPRYNVTADLLEQMRSLYYDTTNVESGSATGMATLWRLANFSRIVYGDDYPMMTEKKLTEEQTGMDREIRRAGLSTAQRGAINHGNALALFPHLAPAVGELG